MDSIGGGAVRIQDLRTGGKAECMFGTTARHLVVSDGDIVAVLVEYLGRDYVGALTRIVVRRLDLSSLVWTTVESIGSDRVFLLSSDWPVELRGGSPVARQLRLSGLVELRLREALQVLLG